MTALLFSTRRRAGFTLLELLVVMAIIVILAGILVSVTGRVQEQASFTKESSNMRQIVVAVLSHAGDNDGFFYSREDIGNSSYRAFDDPLGLPQLLARRGFADASVWLSPKASTYHQKNKNSFACNRSANVCGLALASMTKPSSTAVIWHNYSYTLPSVHNVPEGASSGGPRNAPKDYWTYPYEAGTSAPFGYADGHVEILLLNPKKKNQTPAPTGI